jgi:hypothetical protein
MVLAFILHHPSASLPQDYRYQNPNNNGSAKRYRYYLGFGSDFY